MTDATSDAGVLPILKRRVWRPIVIVLSLALLVLAGLSSLFIVQGVDSQMRDVQHTYEVRRQARELIQALTDAETGQRGYLLTQDEAYLVPYQDAMVSLDSTYQNLLGLVADNPAQKSRVGGLYESIEQKRSEMVTTVEMARNGRLPEALSILRTDAGRTLMSTISGSLNTFIAEEDSKLLERNAQVDNSRFWLVTMIIVALGAAAILAYALLTRSQRQVSTLSRTSTQLAVINAELESRVRARTAELEEARAHAERERARVESLLQETNHRIGNSLATVSSLLGLQVARSRSDEVKAALESAQSRVHSIASGHRRLRLGDDLETTNAAEFLESVIDDIRDTQASGRSMAFHTAVEPMVIKARDATTIGIIVGELVINALKHAFAEGEGGAIWTGFRRDAQGVPVLVVEDNGRGLPPEGAHPESSGMGAMIIQQLANQFGGEPGYEQREGGGARVVLRLPKLTVEGVVLG